MHVVLHHATLEAKVGCPSAAVGSQRQYFGTRKSSGQMGDLQRRKSLDFVQLPYETASTIGCMKTNLAQTKDPVSRARRADLSRSIRVTATQKCYTGAA